MAGRKVLWGILLAGALGLYLFANSAGPLCVLPYSRKNWELACGEAWGEVEVEEDEEPWGEQ